MLLIISFANNISSKVNEALDSDFKLLIDSSDGGIAKAVGSIKKQEPAKVIALGLYSGSDSDMCRLELSCSSRFRNSGTNEKLLINNWLGSRSLKPANGMGNSWCNKLSYAITTKFPNLPFSFIHIPRDYGMDAAIEAIRCAMDDS